MQVTSNRFVGTNNLFANTDLNKHVSWERTHVRNRWLFAPRSLPPWACCHLPVNAAFGDAPKGQSLYTAYCSACHQASGEGLPGAFPPLKGSGVVTKDDATKHINVVLDGLQGGKAGGVVYASAMPALRRYVSAMPTSPTSSTMNAAPGAIRAKPVTAAQVAAGTSPVPSKPERLVIRATVVAVRRAFHP